MAGPNAANSQGNAKSGKKKNNRANKKQAQGAAAAAAAAATAGAGGGEGASNHQARHNGSDAVSHAIPVDANEAGHVDTSIDKHETRDTDEVVTTANSEETPGTITERTSNLEIDSNAEPEPEPEPEPAATNDEAPTSPNKAISAGTDSLPAAPTVDSDGRLEALVRDRDSLRAEVTELRRSLEGIQSKHAKEEEEERAVHQTPGQTHEQDITRENNEDNNEAAQLRKSLQDMETRHAEEKSRLEKDLYETEQQKNDANARFTDLLGKVNTIKSQLQERLNFDADELARSEKHIEELGAENTSLRTALESNAKQIEKLEADRESTSRELTSLRARTHVSQQNWHQEREHLLKQAKGLRDEFEEAKEAMHNWEMLATEERSVRESLENRALDMDDQYATMKADYEKADGEAVRLAVTVEGLQKALEEIQNARKQELRDLVENCKSQIEGLEKKVSDAEAAAAEAKAKLGATQAELETVLPYKNEVKEKNLMIGKLRHEAVTLNEHLTKALRFLKRGKVEDNVDRHLVTNYFLQFLSLDRADPKKFQILQLISALLGWSDEQQERAGLSRPGSHSGQRSSVATATSSPPHAPTPLARDPSTSSLVSDFPSATNSRKESLAELWSGFLEQEAVQNQYHQQQQQRQQQQHTNPGGHDDSTAGHGRHSSKPSLSLDKLLPS